MKKMSRFYVPAFVCVLPMAFASMGLAAEIALVPVRADQPHVIVGNQITVPAGSRVTFEIHVSGWDPNRTGLPLLRAFQVVMDSTTYSSGTQGALTLAKIPCVSDAFCISTLGGACSFAGNPCSSDADCELPQFFEVCRGPRCNVFADSGTTCTAAFIANKRVDWIFRGLASFDAVDIVSPNTRLGSAILGSFVLDEGLVNYTGTLVLDVPADAEGTFTIGFSTSLDTFLVAGDIDNTIIGPTTLTPARLVIGEVACGTDLDCNDDSLCTDDTCVGGTCTFTPNFDETILCCNPGTGSTCGKARAIPGDATLDGVIDLADFLLLQNCFGVGPFPAECAIADINCHCDVTLDDVAAFSKIIVGP